MAEATGLRNNALPYPVYGCAFGVVFPLLDADGDPISPSTPDSEVSKNGDTFTDCTNEATEIATSSGICYLVLTAAEMTADVVAVRIQSTGAKTTVLTFYPRKLPILSTGTCQGSNDTGDIQLASGDSAIDDYYNGCLCVAVIDGTTEARIINDYVGSTKVGEITPAWNTAAPDATDTYTIYLPEGRQVQQANASHINGVSAASVTTINANVGQTQPVNFTGTGGSALVKSDMVDVAGAAVSTSTAQLGVNVVNIGGTVQTAKDLGAINVTNLNTLSGHDPGETIMGATDLGTGSGFTAIPWNAAWDAEVQSEVDDALIVKGLDHLVFTSVAGTDVADNSIVAMLVSKSATADWDTYVNTTDSMEANRDNIGTAGAGLTAADDAVITAIGTLNNITAASVWTVATRELTSGTNIVLAKGTGVTGFNDLSAAQINAEVDTALADYDGPTNAEMVARTLVAASYPTSAQLVKVLAAVYDSVSRSGGVLTLSNGGTQTISATGRATVG